MILVQSSICEDSQTCQLSHKSHWQKQDIVYCANSVQNSGDANAYYETIIHVLSAHYMPEL